ncbi:MAG: alanine--tRNA ligase [Candidatus Mesenet longicola]|uniref:Alanine--tRNA ligase n=1 Tax=Candidatus Mesenet longicola TaxID=1892558 RepID=A0A8J3HUF4_9RICK|nr:MAG: alanine--tRNA ligase [Candidatus Mesenet longicola]GHM59437.1 MAG: alanine--tRNA ligase [Candidatus Mesenet longicola]
MRQGLSISDIRKLFLDFFAKNHHAILPSSSLVPQNDATLMFTNSGMVQFKQIFTGKESSNIKTVATSQKCLRAGGKHNDLENVGYTNRHHTFFEMLGNFSFGNYFKEHAIELAWKFITQELQLDKNRIYVTVYHDDNEAYELWRKISGFSDDKIIRIATADNFWSMGNTGPCGPCSEIFYDYGEEIEGGLPGSKDADGERFVEIWNLVFMQFDKDEEGNLHKLPKQCIDTGMGLERIASVIKGVCDNYETDIFLALIDKSQKKSGDKTSKLAHRIIADHMRAAAFLIAEGVTPANEGASYVLRRIIRRAARYIHQMGCNEPLLHQIFPVLIDSSSSAYMADSYPELIRAKELIEMTLKSEEENFHETLLRGVNLLEKAAAGLSEGDVVSGEVAFKLYDTYGFPLDITLDILKEKKLKLDQEGFDAAMQQQKAKSHWTGDKESVSKVWFDIAHLYSRTEFIGYQLSQISDAKVLCIVSKEEKIIDCANAGEEISIILNKTPFYAESGGQQGDTGELEIVLREELRSKSSVVKVLDTQKMLNSIYVHRCVIKTGMIAAGDIVKAKIDEERRSNLKANHSATHLLHQVLKEVLGGHVAQKGSLVAQDKLRFDFSHSSPLSEEEIFAIENKVNSMIRDNYHAATKIQNTDEAIKEGATALFGEKYEDEVRVVTIGSSKELCGGTHVEYSGEIGFFKVISESAVAFGIRRIEAVTKKAAIDYVHSKEIILQKTADLLKVPVGSITESIQNLQKENKELKQKIENLYLKLLKSENIKVRSIGSVNFLSHVFADIPTNIVRKFVIEQQKYHKTDTVITIAAVEGKKAVLIVSVSDNLTERVNATELIKVINSNGGGSKTLAQVGCSSDEAVTLEIENRLKSIF